MGNHLTLPKINIDTQNDGLEKVTPFKNSNLGYLFVRFLGFFSSLPFFALEKIRRDLKIPNEVLGERVGLSASVG